MNNLFLLILLITIIILAIGIYILMTQILKIETNISINTETKKSILEPKEPKIEGTQIIYKNQIKCPTIIKENLLVWKFGQGDNMIYLGAESDIHVQPIAVNDNEDNFTFYINNQSTNKLIIMTQKHTFFHVAKGGKMKECNKITILPSLCCQFTVTRFNENINLTLINSMNQLNPGVI